MRTIIILMLLPICSFGQIKIGSITLPDSLGLAYLKDCQEHPDTIRVVYNIVYGEYGLSYTSSEEQKEKEKNALYRVERPVTHQAYKDTIWCKKGEDEMRNMGVIWHGRNQRIGCRHKIKCPIEVKDIPERKGTEWFGEYAFTRKPTESDLIKWLKKQNL